MTFDRIAILDWSAAKGPTRGKDSIWLGVTDAVTTTTENIPTRRLAAARLLALTKAALTKGERLLIGADFAFGFPMGFAQVLTGTPTALAVWDWLSAHVTDTDGNVSNYREVAAAMNARFSGDGPFWGNTARQDVPGLSRLKPALPPGLSAHRHCDIVAREGGASPKTVWQLAGVGAVGAQVLTGVPVLNALRHRFDQGVSVWPFQSDTACVVLAEVYPSLLRANMRVPGVVPDQMQVSLLSKALFLHEIQGGLSHLMQPGACATTLAEEGWLLAAGQSALLNSVLSPQT
jgi:hypothetical protein